MSTVRAQLARDAISAVLILVGTAILTWGAWQIDRAVGGVVGGLCLLVLGVALGFGEVGTIGSGEVAGPGLPAMIEEGLTPPESAGVGVRPESTSSTPTPASQLPPDPRPTTATLPASRWIGVHGDGRVGEVPVVLQAEQAAMADAIADTDSSP